MRSRSPSASHDRLRRAADRGWRTPARASISTAVLTATGRTRPAVNTAVDMLARAGVLHPLSAARRNRSWEADGLLDLIARLEAGDPPG